MSTSGSNRTVHFAGTFECPTVAFPCRCGKTHEGDYAAEDFAHHNCFHGVLVVTHPDQAVCRDCGASFQLVYPGGE